MPRGKKQFALIWWMKSAQKDVIPLFSIPKPKRKVNSIVSLTWKDFQTKEETTSVAKILAISGMYFVHYNIYICIYISL